MEASKSNSADGALNLFGRSSLETYSGTSVDINMPDPKDIHTNDITTALSNTCRYGGHVRNYYSVAEHSVLVAELTEWLATERKVRLGVGVLGLYQAALLHDAAEAYCGDVIAPLKWLLQKDCSRVLMRPPVYSDISMAFDLAIASKYRIDPQLFDHPLVKLADLWALRFEAQRLTVSRGEGWRWSDEVLELGDEIPPGVSCAFGLDPQVARVKLRDTMRQHGLD